MQPFNLCFFVLFLCFTHVLSFDVQRLNCPKETCRTLEPLMCMDGVPHINPEDMPINFTVAIYGDCGMNLQSEAAMRMLGQRKPHLVIHAGDLAYDSGPHQPAAWLALVNKHFGNASYVATVGNHDVGESPPGWDLSTSYQAIGTLAQKLGTCVGESGVEMVCTYMGMTIVIVAPGVRQLNSATAAGHEYDVFIADSFRKYPSKWRICVWHKNQRLMQVGTKGDETGWHVYEECRRQGALVITGHEHVYSRSFEMDSFSTQSVTSRTATYTAPTILRPEQTDFSLDILSNSKAVKGTSAVLVVGTGGYGIRRFGPDVNNPWWAAAQAYETGLISGGLICIFNVNGESDRAYCQFHSAYSETPLDKFWFKTDVAVQAQNSVSGLVNADAPSFIRIQVNSTGDDVLEAADQLFCDSPSLHLGAALLPTGLVPGISAFRFQGIPLSASDAELVVGAYISFYIWSSDRNSVPCSLTIQAEASVNSASLCGRYSMRSRPWTNSTVFWRNVQPWDGVDENYRSGMQAESPNLKQLVKDVLLQPGWAYGNAMTFFVQGVGTRSIRSFDMEGGCHAPTLVIEVVNKCTNGAITDCYFPNGYGSQYCMNGYLLPCSTTTCHPGYKLEANACVPVRLSGNLVARGLGCAIPLQGSPGRLGIAALGSRTCELPQAMFEFTQQGPVLNIVSKRGLGTLDQSQNSPIYMLQTAPLKFQLTVAGNLKDIASGACLSFIREPTTGNQYGVMSSPCGPTSFEFRINTPQPTKAPIFVIIRTPAPSPLPTHRPTPKTRRPTTRVPTHYPTVSPTPNPSVSPTLFPTGYPTNEPTQFPTHQPTKTPTKIPTLTPTNSPTNYPTSSPTASPTLSPVTASPTTQKPTTNTPTTSRPTTARPTTLAPTTRAPTTATPTTPAPSRQPTRAPTLPTRRPSKRPTTASPTATVPTRPRPTFAPSFSPVTASPTLSPTLSPITASPTTQSPTTNYPTPSPTLSPTLQPTTVAPTTRAPSTQAPTTLAPTTRFPTTQSPQTSSPTTRFPTTKTPNTRVPTTAAPTTKAPHTKVPTTRFPTTKSPTSKSPTSLSPTTQSPVSTDGPTPAPITRTPTRRRTETPTGFPTLQPTESPTLSPTSESPTPAPSVRVPTIAVPVPTASPVPFSHIGDFATQFAIRLWPLTTANFAAMEPRYRGELAAIARVDPKQVAIVSVQAMPGKASRRLLQNATASSTLEVHTSFINLDEPGSIQKVILMKNAMASGVFAENMHILWPDITCEFAPNQTPKSIDVSIIPSLIVTSDAQKNVGSGSIINGQLQYAWVVDQGVLEMTMTAPTDGWIGFGIAASREGLMLGADVILGWFEGESLHVGDYMIGQAREVSCPAGLCLDTLQPKPTSENFRWKNQYGQDNLVSWGGKHTPGNTTITFKRPLETRDPFDIAIGSGRTTVLFAYGANSLLEYHGSNKASTVIEFVLPEPPLSTLYKYQQKLGTGINAPTIYWTLTDDILDIAFEAQTTGYAAIGFSASGHMVGSYGVVGWQHFDESHLSGVALGGQTVEEVNRGLNSDLELLNRRVSFTNALLTAKWAQRVQGPRGIPTDGIHFVWATGAVDYESKLLLQHTTQRRGSAWVNLKTGPVLPGPEDNFRAAVQTVHAVLMGLAFCACLPMGLAAPLVSRIPPKTLVRGGFLIALIGLGVGIYLVNALDSPHFRQPHSILGLIVILLWCIHVLVLSFVSLAKRPKLRLLHNVSGIVILLVGIVVTYLGTLQSSSVDIAVSAGTSALILSLWLLLVGIIILYMYCRTKSRVANLGTQGADTFPQDNSTVPMEIVPPPTPLTTKPVQPAPLETDAGELSAAAELLPFEPSPAKAKHTNKYKDSASPADVQQLLATRE